jgi:hypothetical protein
MTARGVLFAVTSEDERRLLAAADDEAVAELVEDIEERWEAGFVAETDKAWDAIHRTLNNGRLEYDSGGRLVGRAILGGRLLASGEDYVVVHTAAMDVPAVSAALAAVTEAEFAEGYRRIDPADYGPEHGDEDLAYSWDYFGGVRELWQAAAVAGRAVIFTVDQ